MHEIVTVVETLERRWPRLETRLPLETPEFKFPYGGAGQFIWPRVVVALQDNDTENRLPEFAVAENYYGIRIGALEALADKWPDETTRTLLEERPVQDEDAYPLSWSKNTSVLQLRSIPPFVVESWRPNLDRRGRSWAFFSKVYSLSARLSSAGARSASVLRRYEQEVQSRDTTNVLLMPI